MDEKGLEKKDKLKHLESGEGLSDDVKVTIDMVSNKVFKLVEFTSKIDTSTEDYRDLELYLADYLFSLIDKRKNFSLLNSYLINSEVNIDKIERKVSKNLMIYLPLIIDEIYKEKKGKTDLEVVELIKNYINKIFIIFFVYGDKIELSLVSNLLKKDISELISIEKTFIRKKSKFQKGENKINDSLIEIDSELFSDNDIFTRTYRHVIKLTDEKIKNNSPKSREILQNELLKSELEYSFNGLYNLFLKAIELEKGLDLRLKKLANAFIKLNGLLNSSIETGIIEEGYSLYSEKKYNNEIFKKFYNLLVEGNFDGKNINLEDLENLIIENNKVNKEKNKIKIKEEKDLDPGLNSKNINKKLWLELSTNSKYKFFIHKILGLDKDGFIKIPYFNFFTKKGKAELRIFLSTFGYNENYVNEKIDIINLDKYKGKINLEEFLDSNIDVFTFLYEYYEFTLLSPKNRDEVKENKPDLLNDIIHNLKKSGEISGDNTIKTNGKLYNLSAVGVGDQINSVFFDLSRGHIDLENYKIGKYLFKDCSKLYVMSETSNYSEIIDYLDIGIDTCIKILNGKSLNENELNYLRFLQEFKLIPDDLSKIKISDKDNIIKLLSGLKYVKVKTNTLNQMLNISKDDFDNVSEIFSKIGLTNSCYDNRTGNSIGPDKKFGRVVSKLIKNYNGDFHEFGDLNRFRLQGNLSGENDISSIVQKIIKIEGESGIEKISFENSSGHLLSTPEKKSGYRDLKVDILLSSGNVVEVQIHFEKMITVKGGNAELDKSIKETLERNDGLLNREEVDEFIKIYNEVFGKSPGYNLVKNISTLNDEQLSLLGLSQASFNCDNLYKITRFINNKSLKNKLIKLERIIFNKEWSKIITTYLKENNII